MKRFMLLPLLAVSILLGCKKPPEDAAEQRELRLIPSEEVAEGPNEEAVGINEEIYLAFITNQIADFWKIAEVGVRDAEKDLGGVKVDVRMPPQGTVAEQKRIIEDLMNAGVEGISISPIDPENQTGFLNRVAHEVELITHDSDAPESDRVMYIGMDNYAAGRAAGELVKKALPEGGEVMMFIGRLEQDNSKFRRQGVIDVLMGRDRDQQFYRTNDQAWDPTDEEIKGNGYTVLGTITDQGKQEAAQRKAEDALNSYPSLDAMVGLFEYNPPACYKALEKAGKLGEVALIGFDENDVTLQAIKDGHCTGTVVQNPYKYGYESVRVLKNLLTLVPDTVPEDRYLDIPPRTITQENVDEFWADLRAKKGQ